MAFPSDIKTWRTRIFLRPQLFALFAPVRTVPWCHVLRRLNSVVGVTSLEAKVIATYSGPWIISETSIAIGDLGRVPPGKYEGTSRERRDSNCPTRLCIKVLQSQTSHGPFLSILTNKCVAPMGPFAWMKKSHLILSFLAALGRGILLWDRLPKKVLVSVHDPRIQERVCERKRDKLCVVQGSFSPIGPLWATFDERETWQNRGQVDEALSKANKQSTNRQTEMDPSTLILTMTMGSKQ